VGKSGVLQGGNARGRQGATQGCNVHIVRLIENQRVTKINPPGVKNAKLLILRQTNNVYVAPFAHFPKIKPKPTKNRQIFTDYEKVLQLNIKFVTFERPNR